MFSWSAGLRLLPDDPSLVRDLRRVKGILIPFFIAGATGMVLFVISVSSAHEALGRLGFVFAIAAAAAACGGLTGFIFGVPKMLQGSGVATGRPAEAVNHDAGTLAASPPRSSVVDNTNLEEISDWLTKLLVGATLTQLGKIPDFVGVLSARLAENWAAPGAKPFLGALAVFWAIYGFFVAYLLTRRVLPSMWREASRMPADAREEIDAYFARRQRGKDGSPPTSVRGAAALALDEVRDSDLATWGRAQLARDRFDLAVAAFEKVLARTPEDARAQGDLVFASLYLPAPRGFEKAIAEGERMAQKSPPVLVYLAAAYGQKYRWARNRRASEAELKELRSKALDYARRGITADVSWTEVVRGMLDPKAVDDDLSAFTDDPEFRALVNG